jgi:hypothetical protein
VGSFLLLDRLELRGRLGVVIFKVRFGVVVEGRAKSDLGPGG